jgi:hypothetical protein
MQNQWKSAAIAAAPRPPHPAGRTPGFERQVSTYLLYRSFSTDERNRRGLKSWREALRRHDEESR